MEGRGSWTEKRVLVTGATGFIGQYLVQGLRQKKARFYAGTSPNADLEEMTTDREWSESLRAFDIRDGEAVREIVEDIRPHVVFHLAAAGVTRPNVDPAVALRVNTEGAVNVLEALKESDVERVVLVGTSYEYGLRDTTKQLDPINAYAASKVAAWSFGRMYWHVHRLPVIVVRPFQVYGPGQPTETLIPAAVKAALSGADFPMTPGKQKRDFIFVEDVVDGMIAAAETVGLGGLSLDLGTGCGTQVESVVRRIWTLVDGEGKIQPGAFPYRLGTAVDLVADAERTTRLTGWRAVTPLEEGLRATVQELKRDV
jgi:nucleoside-diphosphate-sugar epimerase